MLAEFQREADILGEINWEVHFLASTTVRTHQHSAGGGRGDPLNQAIGLSRDRVSNEVDLSAEGKGKPITFILTPGQ